MSPAPDASDPRRASADDRAACGRLLHDFNTEFGEATPGPERMGARLGELIDGGDTDVLVVGAEPVAIAVLRFRPSLWTEGAECTLAELYVVPDRRGRGLGRRLMAAVLDRARERGATSVEIGVDEPDTVARHLYERCGFTNRVGGTGGVMFHYERDL